MLVESGPVTSLSPEALEAEYEQLRIAAREAARAISDERFGVKLLACGLRFRARMTLLRLAILAGLAHPEGRLLDPLREMRRLLDGAGRTR